MVLPRQPHTGAQGENKVYASPVPEWTNQLAPRDSEELHPLLDDLEQLKAERFTDAVVAISFCCRLIQTLQDQTHPALEY
jgi:hypothetical protein